MSQPFLKVSGTEVTDLSPVDVKQRLFQARRALAAQLLSTH